MELLTSPLSWLFTAPAATEKAASASTPKQTDETPVTNERVVDLKTLVFFGLALNLGTFVSWWNVFFEMGFYGTIVGVIFIGVLHILLALCIAEMTSVIPFAGGSFGYVRCTLGPFWGYLVGASELIQNFFFGCALIRELGRNAEIAFDATHDVNVRPKAYAAFYIALLLAHCVGGSFYWRSVNLFGLLAVAVITMFVIESFHDYNLNHYGFHDLNGFHNDPAIFMRRLHYLIPPFMGLQILPLTSERVIEVRKNMPIALMVCTCVSAVVLLLVTIAAAGVKPGVSSALFKTRCSMCFTMVNNMDMTVEQGNLLSLFVIMGSTLGYFYSCGHQMHAMAMSGLLPQFLRRTFGPNRQPVTCFVISAVLQCAACIILHYDFEQFSTTRMTCISVSFVYLAMFASYMVFATRFSNMQREFTSPLGMYGAVVGIVLALGLWIGTMFFQENYDAMSIYLVFIGINVVWYFAYVQFHQFFSEEEQNKFLRAYVTNANKMSKRRNKKGGATYAQTYLPFLVVLFKADFFSRRSSTNSNSQNQSSVGGASSAATQSRQSRLNSVHDATKVDTHDAATVANAASVVSNSASAGESLPANAPLVAHSLDTTSSVPASRRTSLRWSGKLLNDSESHKVFQSLIAAQVEAVAEEAPGKFDTVSDPDGASDVMVVFDEAAGEEVRGVELI